MSLETGRKILNLEPTERVGRTEYMWQYPSLIQEITGIDPLAPDMSVKAFNALYQHLDFDIIWHSNDGPPWQGRVTSMGHAEYEEGGTDMNYNVYCPFSSPEEVLEFDAVEEYGLPDIEERAAYYQQLADAGKANYPDLIFPGGYYKTIVSAAIHTFGWNMFLTGVGTDPDKFGRDVLEGFFKITQANIKAWAKTDIEAFVSHDDMVWTEGAIFRPEFYRNYIFPRYKELWRPLKEKGIKVLFCSDGNFTEFVDDIVWAGADGFIFEPLTSLEYIAEKYSSTHIIVGNADTRILTFGTKDQIKAEVERCMKAAKHCPGFIMAVGNHIPPNVPKENALYYFDLVNEMGKR